MSGLSSLRPARHDYDPDALTQGATCATCGFDRAFGNLHIDPAYDGPPPVDLEPDICGCGHPPHADPCRYFRPLRFGSQTRKLTCDCRERAALTHEESPASMPGPASCQPSNSQHVPAPPTTDEGAL